ncbi:MAG: RBBP9/YdeN family alpha/beta hydrolase [Nanoarchaeota archaeon]
MNVIIVHGTNSSEESSKSKEEGPENLRHWKSWLVKKLEKKGIEVSNKIYPQDWNPKYNQWKKEFEKNNINEDAILIGHSSGGAFLVRWLGETKTKVKKLILVSPGKSKKQRRNTLDDLYGNKTYKNIQKYVKYPIILYTSNNDIPQHIKGAREYKKELPARIINLKNKGHFTEKDMGTKEFPELLQEILK